MCAWKKSSPEGYHQHSRAVSEFIQSGCPDHNLIRKPNKLLGLHRQPPPPVPRAARDPLTRARVPGPGSYSIRIPAARMILPVRAMSALMPAANSAGELATTSMPTLNRKGCRGSTPKHPSGAGVRPITGPLPEPLVPPPQPVMQAVQVASAFAQLAQEK